MAAGAILVRHACGQFGQAHFGGRVVEDCRDPVEHSTLIGLAHPGHDAVGLLTLDKAPFDQRSELAPYPWTSYSIDLGTLAPGVYQIRFAETDNVNWYCHVKTAKSQT
jgi:hypothetical protein